MPILVIVSQHLLVGAAGEFRRQSPIPPIPGSRVAPEPSAPRAAVVDEDTVAPLARLPVVGHEVAAREGIDGAEAALGALARVGNQLPELCDEHVVRKERAAACSATQRSRLPALGGGALLRAAALGAVGMNCFLGDAILEFGAGEGSS